MNKLDQYDSAVKTYVGLLKEGADGNADHAELIRASADVQNVLSEVLDLNRADHDFVEAVDAYLKGLANLVKGRQVDNLDELEAAYMQTRRRVIIEAPAEVPYGNFEAA